MNGRGLAFPTYVRPGGIFGRCSPRVDPRTWDESSYMLGTSPNTWVVRVKIVNEGANRSRVLLGGTDDLVAGLALGRFLE